MRRHLRYRLMGMMMLLVLLIVSFVGVMLFSTIALDYNRKFYTDMNELVERINFFDMNQGNIVELIKFLPRQETINPLTTDRNYYILRGDTVINSNSDGGIIEKTANLQHVLAGGKNKMAGIFSKELDFACNLAESDYTLYVVDHRSELISSIRAYIALFFQALLIGSALTVALSFLFARRFLIPIQRLTKSAKAMQEEGEFTQIPATTKDEVGELTRVFNEMGVRITKNINMLQELLRNIPKPLFATNEQGTIVHVNEAFKLLFDQPPKKSLFLEGHEQDSRFMIQFENRFFCVYRSPLLLENGGEGALFLLDDITEAETLENERKQFVANVSHELKTPLTVIKSYSETMLESRLDAQTSRQFLQVIDKATDQMNAMVNQLLELSKAEGAPPGVKEPLDLVAAVGEVAEAMQLEMRKKGLRCVLHTPPQRILICEPDKVRRVMVNLLSNSVKYSSAQGTVTVSIREAEGGVLFQVADEGIGIEKKHLPHLFDKFYRVDKARSRETGGTGLGLSIVHSIVTGMGGRVTVESTYGKGSVFTCFFPG